ncbi:hypothetical protein Ocin01_06286, partial [Orchesella cincta]
SFKNGSDELDRILVSSGLLIGKLLKNSFEGMLLNVAFSCVEYPSPGEYYEYEAEDPIGQGDGDREVCTMKSTVKRLLAI